MPYVQRSDRPKKKTVQEMTPEEKKAAYPNTENAGVLPQSVTGQHAVGSVQLNENDYNVVKQALGFTTAKGAQPNAFTDQTIKDIQARDTQTAIDRTAKQQIQQQQFDTQVAQQVNQQQQQMQPKETPISPNPPQQVQPQQVQFANGQTGTYQSLEQAPQVNTELPPSNIAKETATKAAIVTISSALGAFFGAGIGGVLTGGLATATLGAFEYEANQEAKTTLTKYNTARKNLATAVNNLNAIPVKGGSKEEALKQFQQAEQDIWQAEQEVQKEVNRLLTGSSARDEFIKIMDYRRSDRQTMVDAFTRAWNAPDPNAPVRTWNADLNSVSSVTQ